MGLCLGTLSREDNKKISLYDFKFTLSPKKIKKNEK